MRKVKFPTEEKLAIIRNASNGRGITCPHITPVENGISCFIYCAWFNIVVRHPMIKNYTLMACCKDQIIGQIVNKTDVPKELYQED